MNILVFGPCELWRDIVWGKDWDCTDHTSPMSLVVYIALLVGTALTVYFTLFYGETEKAKTRRAKISQWPKSLKDRGGFHELKAWEIALFGSAAGLVLMGAWLYMDGPSFASIVLPLLFSIALVFMVWIEAHKENEDPHRDIPAEVRAKTNQELKEHKERLDLFNQIREAMGQQATSMFDTAKNLYEIDLMEKQLKQQYPGQKKDIELMAEVRRMRIKEKL
jgi:hypothetical protein